MVRDFSRREFVEKLERRGGKLDLFGYVSFDDLRHVLIYRFNGGDRLRDQLAYLIRAHERAKRRHASERGEETTGSPVGIMNTNHRERKL